MVAQRAHGPLAALLVGLTVVTGLADAFGYVSLAHVLVANMTGNVVFLGFGPPASGDIAVASLAAIAAFVCGAAVSGRWAPARTTTRGPARGRDGWPVCDRTQARGAGTGSLEGDLVGLLTSVAGVLAGSTGTASRALLGVMNDEPTLAAAFREGPMAWGQAFGEVFAQAVVRGEVAPDASTSLAAETGPAIFLLWWTISDRAIDAELAVAVVREVMISLLRTLASASSSSVDSRSSDHGPRPDQLGCGRRRRGLDAGRRRRRTVLGRDGVADALGMSLQLMAA